MVNRYGTDEVVFQTLTGTLQSDDGSPLLSTSSDGGTAYAIGDALSAGIYSGIQNGNLSAPPQAVGSADPISDSNPLPYFTFVDGSSGRITAYAVEDSLQANGFSIRFRAIGAQSGDRVYLERRVSAPSSRAQSYVYSARAAFTAASNTAGYSAFVESQYLKADGTTTTGAAGTTTTAGTSIFGYNATALELVNYPAASGAVPTDGASILFRTGISFSTAVAGTVSIDLVEMRLVRGTTVVPFVDQEYPGQAGAVVGQTAKVFLIHSNALGTAGSNPKFEMNTNTGSIYLNAAGTITGGGTPTSGDIELRTKDGGYVYFGEGTATAVQRISQGETRNLHHGITLQRTTTLSLGTAVDGSATAITWSSAVKNTNLYAYWSTGSTITIPVTGWFSITCHMIFASGTGYAARLYALINGTVIAETDQQAQANTFADTISIATLAYLTSGDSLVFRAAASTTGKTIGGSGRNRCSVVYIGNTSS
jgi:hypothetical protein